jgi:glycosyltransferase involved in cell wall biosynthesis
MTLLQPLLSVVVPSFNRPLSVVRAARSVMEQTEPGVELIVVDDGSSPHIERAALGSDPRISLVRTESNLGAAGARNLGISRARGEWVAFLDDDDELLPRFAEITLDGLSSSPNADFSWSSVRFLDEGGQGTVTERRFHNAGTELQAVAQALSVGTGFGLTVRASKLREIGGFRTDVRLTEDTDLLIRLLDHGCRPTVIEPVLVHIHNHHGERMTSRANNELRSAETDGLLNRYSDFFDQFPSVRRQLEGHVRLLKEEHYEHQQVYSLVSEIITDVPLPAVASVSPGAGASRD